MRVISIEIPREEYGLITLVDILAQNLDITVEQVERWLAMPATAIYDDPAYQALIHQIDNAALERTQPQVRAVYETGLPPIKAKFQLQDTIMSGYTLSNWVLGFLMYPDRARDILGHHARIAPEVVYDVLPELVDLLDDSADCDCTEWKRALLIFSLPLLAAR